MSFANRLETVFVRSFFFCVFDREKVDLLKNPLALHTLLFTGCSLRTKQKYLHIYVYKYVPCCEGRREKVPTPQVQVYQNNLMISIHHIKILKTLI